MNRGIIFSAFAASVSLGICGAAFADMGGQGYDQTPSVSAPRYDAAAEYQKGSAALKAKNFKVADTAFSHALEVSPDDANTLVMSGAAKSGLGDHKGARDAYKKALAGSPQNIQAHRGLGLALISLGDKAGSAKELDMLQKRAGTCGDACADAAELKAAISSLKAASDAPGRQSLAAPPSALLNESKIGDSAYVDAVRQINEHRYADALRELQQAQKVFGPHPDVLTYIGYTYRKLGRYDTAESYYKQALAIAPEHRGAIEYYGELKVERGDIKGARRMLAKLDTICSFGCVEAEDLRRWVSQGHG